ncbi:hypothetical protein L6232_20440, partial [Shewanella sp. C31]|nr:hypothetical protein [Shewanella electrica]
RYPGYQVEIHLGEAQAQGTLFPLRLAGYGRLPLSYPQYYLQEGLLDVKSFVLYEEKGTYHLTGNAEVLRARLALPAASPSGEHLAALSLAADLLARLAEGGEGDLLGQLEALLEARRTGRGPLLGVERVAALWRKRLGVRPLTSLPPPEEVGRLLLYAYPDRVAERVSPGRYRLASGPLLRLEGDGPPYLVAAG